MARTRDARFPAEPGDRVRSRRAASDRTEPSRILRAAQLHALGAGNVSAALHYLSRSGRNEMYLVYGDPNSLITTPAFFVKYILYVGAPKGT